jgi:prepilin-type N-terminal cleavage/methylation domain-containing protein
MRNGFSLLEVIIVVTIAASIVIVVGNLGSNTNALNSLVSQELQSKVDISQTLQTMVSEIRSAGPSQGGAYPVESASTSSFAFYSDINKDGVIEHVRYFLASSSIEKGIIAPTGTPAAYPISNEIVTDLVDNIIPTTSTPLFSYYDSAYSGTQAMLAMPVDVSVIRLVQIGFYADTKSTQAPSAQYFSAFVDIRNLRSN